MIPYFLPFTVRKRFLLTICYSRESWPELETSWSQIDWSGMSPFLLDEFMDLWPEDRADSFYGLVLFGSRLRGEATERSDLDIGVVYTGPRPLVHSRQDSWDLFFWNLRHWKLGFVLQVEIARAFYIVDDRTGALRSKLQEIEEFILPHWAGYVPRL